MFESFEFESRGEGLTATTREGLCVTGVLRSSAWKGLIGMLAVALIVTSTTPASASTETLKRSVSNILWGPFDMALSPVTTAINLTRKMMDVDDSVAVRVIFAVPGYIWTTGVGMGGGGLRAITGCLELVPGLLLIPFEADLDPLFDPVDRAPALVDIETPCCLYMKFGIDYTTVGY